MNLQDLTLVYEETLNRINQAEAGRILSSDDAEFARQQALFDYNTEVAAFSGYEVNTNEDAVFAGNTVGEYILSVGNQLGYSEYEALVEDLAEFAGASVYDIDDVITSDYEPTEEEAYAILSELGLLDDDEYEDEYEDMSDEYEEDPEYSNYVDTQADFTSARINELEDTIAEFQTRQLITDELTKRYNTAVQMVEAGDLPMVTFNRLFPDTDDAVAEFAASCLEDNWSPEDKLKNIDYILACFSELGLSELGLFGAEVEDAIEFASEDAAIENIAYENFKLFQQRNN